MIDTCPGANNKKAATVKGEVFAFLNSSFASGTANLLSLKRTFILSEGGFKDEEFQHLANCATEKAIEVLEKAGVRLLRSIRDFDTEYKYRSFVFFPTSFFDSVSAYVPVRVRRGHSTIIEINKLSCEAQFAVAYVVYPFDSLQPGYEPSPDVQQPTQSNFTITLGRDSPEITKAISESKTVNANEPYKSAYLGYINSNPNELWVWIFLSSKDKSCSTQISVSEDSK
ncbi:hypothetical protein [Rhizobium leguminosarum]|uniref:hypothetical protein n=1 Tax=Rhizobium leguminosarum TaxID=384 RepID=UPI000FEC9A00|nr:hypothetical protein [Rhizobium leguminosarum]RWX22851.1 hypothetical protein EHI43_34950 [Rhizobium leguminosarum]